MKTRVRLSLVATMVAAVDLEASVAERGVIIQNGDYIYLAGQGASAEGDRPFLDRLNLKTLAH